MWGGSDPAFAPLLMASFPCGPAWAGKGLGEPLAMAGEGAWGREGPCLEGGGQAACWGIWPLSCLPLSQVSTLLPGRLLATALADFLPHRHNHGSPPSPDSQNCRRGRDRSGAGICQRFPSSERSRGSSASGWDQPAGQDETQRKEGLGHPG